MNRNKSDSRGKLLVFIKHHVPAPLKTCFLSSFRHHISCSCFKSIWIFHTDSDIFHTSCLSCCKLHSSASLDLISNPALPSFPATKCNIRFVLISAIGESDSRSMPATETRPLKSRLPKQTSTEGLNLRADKDIHVEDAGGEVAWWM